MGTLSLDLRCEGVNEMDLGNEAAGSNRHLLQTD